MKTIGKQNRIRWIVCGTLVLLILAFVLGLPAGKTIRKKSTFHYVLAHQTELNAYAAQILEERPLQTGNYNGWSTSFDLGTQQIDFSVRKSGLVSSGTYCGFYFSPEDVPTGIGGSRVALTPEKNGWGWREPDGDNRQYIEKICDHWYWYEASF